MAITSAKVQEGILKCLSDGKEHDIQSIKRYLVRAGILGYSDGQFSGSLTTMVRNKSVNKVGRGVYTAVESNLKTKKCFIISSREKSVKDDFEKLFRHIIRPVCEKCGFELTVTEHLRKNSFSKIVMDELDNCDLVIADISDVSPHVFFEIGYRTKTQKPIICLKNIAKQIPFDLQTFCCLEYNLTDLDSVELTKKRLENIIEAVSHRDFAEVQTKSSNNTTAEMMSVMYQIFDMVSEMKSADERNMLASGQLLPNTAMQLAEAMMRSDNADLLQRIKENK